MKDIQKLTDEQLIILFKNENIDKELKKSIITEIDRRELQNTPINQENLDLKSKLIIFFCSPLFFKYLLKKSSAFLSNGNKKAYKQCWMYFVFGFAFYGIIIFLCAKFLLSTNLDF